MCPPPCPPPSPSSCSPSPLSWRLQPCNSPALKAKINRCQQLAFWEVAAAPPPCPRPCACGLLVPGQAGPGGAEEDWGPRGELASSSPFAGREVGRAQRARGLAGSRGEQR